MGRSCKTTLKRVRNMICSAQRAGESIHLPNILIKGCGSSNVRKSMRKKKEKESLEKEGKERKLKGGPFFIPIVTGLHVKRTALGATSGWMGGRSKSSGRTGRLRNMGLGEIDDLDLDGRRIALEFFLELDALVLAEALAR